MSRPGNLWRRAGGALSFAWLVAAACAGEPQSPPPVPPQPAAPAAPGILALDPPAQDGAMAPSLSSGGAGGGAIHLTWIEPAGEGKALRFARFGAGAASGREESRWGEAGTVVAQRPFFANWADVPSMEIAGDGRWFAHWLEKSGPDTYAYDVLVSSSRDEGRSWSPPTRLNDDRTPTEHGFVSLVPDGAGVRAFWLDGRDMVSETGRMALRSAMTDPAPGSGEILDASTCECCQTGAAVTSGGPVIVYRGRGQDEVRDIRIVRRARAGWSAPESVHDDGWVVPGCPVNGPAISALGPGSPEFAVAWFTGAQDHPRVLLSFSTDAGVRFGEPVVVDDQAPPGRADVAMIGSQEAIVAWVAGPGTAAGPAGSDAGELRMRRVAADGRSGDPLTLSSMSLARGSGFPRIARSGDALLAVWTDPGPPMRLRGRLVPLARIPPLNGIRSVAGEPVSGRREPSRDRTAGYEAVTLDGATWSLDAQRGEVVLLNLWATWCLPCRDEMPALEALHRAWSGRGLRVVGVSVDPDGARPEVARVAEQLGISYPVLLDPGDIASRRFDLSMLPTTLLFDRSGAIVWRRDGVILEGDPGLARAIEESLGGGPPAGGGR